ncbi:thiol reductant ABC exporter subunit CydD [Ammonifex thiophilus]|uniref:thiol reductant ABC exporter subunit CydD n=1 Tax=Ammonifex thiophilus TaxID=444093 RepID=UPI001402B71D|nr:thiol reductant ABC exporter subunit CydD [Ammonifex thiophilus]
MALAPKKKSFLWGLTGALGLAAGLLAAGQAGCLAWIVELVYLRKAGLEEAMPWVGLLLLLFALRLLTQWGRELAAFSFALRVEEGLREALFRQFVDLGPLVGLETKAGEKVCLLLDKVEAVGTYFNRYLPLLVTAGMVAFVLLLFALVTLPVAGLIFLVSTLVAVALLILIGKWADGRAQERWKLMGYLNDYLLDLLQGLVTLKLFGRSREHVEKLWLLGERFRVATMEVLRVTFLSALVLELITTLGTAMVAVTVSLRLLAGKMPFFPAFFLILLAPEYYLSLRQLSQRYHIRLAGVAAAQEIAAYLNLTSPVFRSPNPLPPPSGPLEVTFREVTYAYREEGDPVLKGVSFSLLPGEKVALLGPTGAGKSTLAYLLLRFADPQGGEILVNGLPLKEIDPREWRRQVSFLPQQPRLWPGTVLENLGLDETVPWERVEEVLQILRVKEIIEAFPQGYATRLGEGGQCLSGGQVQRLALARAFLKPASLLILDEPTTGLDPENELAFLRALETLAQDKTVLLITHHLNVLEYVDRILLLQEGRLVEAGRLEELKKSPGVLLAFL